ncbi:MAG TPA: tetratricopeptide repeat protein [Gemmatimonadales bacterium]|nr:tetratricopeptide repeat protein [Gemmatimonadales bacterium]
MPEALVAYRAAIAAAERTGERTIVAESLRRLGVAQHHRGERMLARELCERSRRVASEIGDSVLAGEAQNALAGFEFEAGNIEGARERFYDALALAGSSPGLRGRIEQNLGILVNIQGALTDALAHYQRSLDAFRASGDERGCAIAYHNLGMVSADRGRWDQADDFYGRTLEVAQRIGDRHLEGLARLNQSEVHLARRCYDDARSGAETALEIFNQLGARLDKADAYKLIGRVYRETGRWALAESRVKGAFELAVGTGSVLSEAEASRELALLYQAMGGTRTHWGCSTLPTASSPGSTPASISSTSRGRSTGLRKRISPWSVTGGSPSSRRTATRTATASGWPPMPRQSRRRCGWTISS